MQSGGDGREPVFGRIFGIHGFSAANPPLWHGDLRRQRLPCAVLPWYAHTVSAHPPSYTVVLTKGAHIVPAEDAAAIQRAIEAGEKFVRVRFEDYPGSEVVEETTLVTAHIISLSEVPQSHAEIVNAAGPKVRSLHQFRFG